MRLKLTDIVTDTFTNSGGFQLFSVLDPHVKNNNPVELSFKDSHALSSSFLNSSIGELISKYGFEAFKANVKPVELRKTQAEILLSYIRSCGLKV
jgi:hypothetical protein